MRPGATQLTRMLCSEYVEAAPSASDATAPLAAARMSWLAVPSWDTAAEVRTMEPPCDDLSPLIMCVTCGTFVSQSHFVAVPHVNLHITRTCCTGILVKSGTSQSSGCSSQQSTC